MASRDGFYSIRRHAVSMCKFIQAFSPIIAKKYNNNAALMAALAAAMAACEVLVSQIDEHAEEGV